MSQALTIGPMRPDEVGFVAKATKEHLRHSPKYAKKSNYVAYGVINPLVNGMFQDAVVLVARDARNTRDAYGFVLFALDGRMFVYVKHDARRRGVARELLEAALAAVPEDAPLEGFFPNARFSAVAERYGFWLPEDEKEVSE